MKYHVELTGNYDYFRVDPATANVGKLKPLTNTEWLQQHVYFKAGLPVDQDHSAMKIDRTAVVDHIIKLLEEPGGERS